MFSVVVALGVPERPLDGHHVAAGRDQSGGVEVAQVVQPDPSSPAASQRRAPPVADGVLVRRIVLGPANSHSPRCAELDVRATGSPPARRGWAPCAPSRTSGAGSRPRRRSRAAPAAGRGAVAAGSPRRRPGAPPPRRAAGRRTRTPPRTRGSARRPRSRSARPPRRRDRHRRLALALTGQPHPLGRVARDQPVPDAARNTERTFTNRVLIVPGASGRPSAWRHRHRLDPRLDVVVGLCAVPCP